MQAPADVFRLALRTAVETGYLSPKQASDIAKRITVNITDLPGREPLDATITSEAWPMIFLELLGLANGETGLPRVAWQEAQRRISAMKIEEWMRIHEGLQDQFEKRNARFAFLLFTGAMSLAAWRVNFWHIVKRLFLSQAALGAHGVPLGLVALAELLKREADYVHRFAEAVFAGRAAAAAGVTPEKRTPTTEGQIRSRGDLYTGVPRGVFYQQLEDSRPLELGFVIEYVAKDDVNTCDPCSRAAGYYLPGTGPMPGQVCEGQGKCRCIRRQVFFPEKHKELQKLFL
jgi:hypothetical protein